MEKKKIYLSSPHMSEEGYEMEYIKEAFASNWVAPLGENVNCFEKELAELTGAKEAAALNTGTAAIHLALKAAGVARGDLVLCPTLTFSATVNPVLYEGAIPVFLDSEEASWNLSPEVLEKALRKYGSRVKAVLVVHLYGICADMERIEALCRAYQVPLIEDAAEALGSRYHGKSAGSMGAYGIYSFNGNKIITTSGGGMAVCNLESEGEAEERIQKIRFWATQAREPERHYEHRETGYNYRMSNIVAGIGRGQLKVLQSRVERKREIFAYYRKHLSEYLVFMPEPEGTYNNCWLSCAQVKKETGASALELIEALERENIESRPVWKPMHLQPVFKGCEYLEDTEHGGVAERLFRNGICLPSDTKMSESEQERVIAILKECFEGRKRKWQRVVDDECRTEAGNL